MASNNSGPISPGSSYTLGEYVFTLQNVVSEDERIIQAHITGPEGSAAKGITVETSAQLESWRVEANDTEASVYALIKESVIAGLPDTIKVTVMPDKTAYEDGEDIDLTGLIVTAYSNNGTTVWTNDSYPDGIIPIDELESEIALIDKQVKESDLGVTVACSDYPLSYSWSVTSYGNIWNHTEPHTNSRSSVITIKDPYSDKVVTVGKAFAVHYIKNSYYNGNVTDTRYEYYGYVAWDQKHCNMTGEGAAYTHNNKSVQDSGPYYIGTNNVIVYDPEHNIYESANCTFSCPDNGVVPSDIEHVISKMAWVAVFGDDKTIQTTAITLSWQRPVDGVILSTSFEITVQND